MTAEWAVTALRRSLLRVAFHSDHGAEHRSRVRRFAIARRRRIDYHAFCDAVAACLREGLIREPIRLPEGALQCHWHLELTPKGVRRLARGRCRATN